MSDLISGLLVIVKMLIAIAPFLLLCLVGAKINLHQTERSKQFIMPLISIVFSFVIMLLIHPINKWLIRMLERLPKAVASIADAFSDPIGSLFNRLSTILENIINGLDLKFWVFFFANAVIIAMYLIVKKIALRIMKSTIKNDSELHKKVSGIFYAYFSDNDVWVVREDYVRVRNFLRVFFGAAIAISSLLMLVSKKMYDKEMLKTVFYPVFSVIIVGELFYYLNGLCREEYIKDILGEDEVKVRNINYSLLRNFMRKLFGDKVLSDNVSVNNALQTSMTNDEVVKILETEEDPTLTAYATFVRRLNASGFRLDHNYVFLAADLLRGKSVLVNNPFYNDLIPYAFYPMHRALLSHQKVLIVLGRHSIENDIVQWVENGIRMVTNIPFLWNIGVLKADLDEVDIGILSCSEISNGDIVNSQSDFLKDVGFCVIIEPSRLVTSAQIGLSMIVRRCKEKDERVTFCMCDRNCDGLVDAMSHILMTSITEVTATIKHTGTSSYMCWDADGEHLHHRMVSGVSRYLGVGTELAFSALRNQVTQTKWFGGEAFPVRDMHWIAQQYYFTLNKYAGLPANQEAFNEGFYTTNNYWSAEVSDHNYFVIEDESNNMFEVLRNFATRSLNQGFINVVSTDYLLRDYMAANASIFETDPKAIPYIVADYARSERNTILRLVLMMSMQPVRKTMITKEFDFLGIPVFDIRKQLWYEIFKCYSTIAAVQDLPSDYKNAVLEAYDKPIIDRMDGEKIYSSILLEHDYFDIDDGVKSIVFSISDKPFTQSFVHTLRSAQYILEDEAGEKHFLGSELCGHIYQKHLPGQFFTFGGKYYENLYLTADGRALVRRAADHIFGRPTYRQIRNYKILDFKRSDQIGSCRDVSGIKVVHLSADFNVSTDGYYRMEQYHDFSTAKKVLFDADSSGIPVRRYNNKQILRIEFTGAEVQCTPQIRQTITMLLNEVFRTLFAENQAFICAVTPTKDADILPLTYTVTEPDSGCVSETLDETITTEEIEQESKNYIYIIEDSELDLGLLIAVERNLERIFKIVHDFLDWHFETLAQSIHPSDDPAPIVPKEQSEGTEVQSEDESSGLKRIGKKISNWFKNLLNNIKRKKGLKEPIEVDLEETPAQEDDVADEEVQIAPAPVDADVEESDAENNRIYFDKAPDREVYRRAAEELEMLENILSEQKEAEIYTDVTSLTEDTTIAEDVPVMEKTTFVEDVFDAEATDSGDLPFVDASVADDDAPVIDDAPVVGDASVTDDAPVEDDVPVTDNAPVADDAPVTDNAPVADDAPVTDNVPVADDAPITDDVSVADDAPVADDVLIEAEMITEEGSPIESDPFGFAQYGEFISEDDTSIDIEIGSASEAMPESASHNDVAVEDEVVVDKEKSTSNAVRTPYHERYFLLFGDKEEPKTIDVRATMDFLTKLGFGRNELKQARENKNSDRLTDETFIPNQAGKRYCDFCGAEIIGVEYETLSDGRDRCMTCSRTAITTGEEFKKIFEDVKRNMEAFFGIKLNVGVHVEMVNSKKLHRRLGKTFTPTPKQDGRVLGVAIRDKSGFSLLVENGSPRISSMLTMAHELTHIWQYSNWNEKKINQAYGKKKSLLVYEGMAKWVEIQYAYLINEPIVAKREEIITSYRDDEYGQGFLLFRENYPFSTGTSITKPTPFLYKDDPLTSNE